MARVMRGQASPGSIDPAPPRQADVQPDGGGPLTPASIEAGLAVRGQQRLQPISGQDVAQG